MIIVQHYTTNMNAGPYGNPNMPAGGKAIRYNCLYIAEFSKVSVQDSDPVTKETGLKFHVRFTKNHCVMDRNPYRDFFFCVEYGKGIEKYITTMQELLAQGILTQKGPYIYLLNNGEKDPNMSWLGKNAFKEDMIAHPEKFDTLCSLLDVSGTVQDLSEEDISQIEEDQAHDEEAATEAVSEEITPEEADPE